MIAQFEVGRVYMKRSRSDHDCIYQFKILSRTPKTITFAYQGEVRRRGVKVRADSEICLPFGRYANCPVIDARGDRLA